MAWTCSTTTSSLLLLLLLALACTPRARADCTDAELDAWSESVTADVQQKCENCDKLGTCCSVCAPALKAAVAKGREIILACAGSENEMIAQMYYDMFTAQFQDPCGAGPQLRPPPPAGLNDNSKCSVLVFSQLTQSIAPGLGCTACVCIAEVRSGITQVTQFIQTCSGNAVGAGYVMTAQAFKMQLEAALTS
eukprot:CAMPEP_0202873278 /NCGR_PEP_ID=MMETSP1391-20130828/22975_1 /ASSEMBLY_ACC=CAM_ASM_000867 /TAXON_ID=1034604 /ORGANISM="Chlamydomonas leiostraca, Strain SAG 11-49" /LENGTH=192 /DNA_ID=CAMNT_0049554475 /DNA_START=199 /DNA_END=773 /DNA_ORIENTATION=+